jgi:hypothetical protein
MCGSGQASPLAGQKPALRLRNSCRRQRAEFEAVAPCCSALGVSFQEVVHPVLNEEAEVVEALANSPEGRMDIHKNAPLTPKGREAMVRRVVEAGLTQAVAARQFNTTAFEHACGERSQLSQVVRRVACRFFLNISGAREFYSEGGAMTPRERKDMPWIIGALALTIAFMVVGALFLQTGSRAFDGIAKKDEISAKKR